MDPTLTLAQSKVGTLVRIRTVDGARRIRQRLMEMGLVPNTCVQVVGRAPWGDPMRIRMRNYELSLRHSEASMVHVELVQHAN